LAESKLCLRRAAGWSAGGAGETRKAGKTKRGMKVAQQCSNGKPREIDLAREVRRRPKSGREKSPWLRGDAGWRLAGTVRCSTRGRRERCGGADARAFDDGVDGV